MGKGQLSMNFPDVQRKILLACGDATRLEISHLRRNLTVAVLSYPIER
jgi:hypothetical protein